MTSKTVLIEYLDWPTLPLWLWHAIRDGGGYFIDASPFFMMPGSQRFLNKVCRLRQLRYEDFPGSYLETQTRATTGFNDDVLDRSPANEREPILSFLKQFHNHPLMEVALRKVVLETYTVGRVKTLVLLQRLLASHAGVVFLPEDHRHSDYWPTAQIPLLMCFFNFLRGLWSSFTTLGYAWASVIYLVMQRGVILRSPATRNWPVGLDTFNSGIAWTNLYHSYFLYGKEELAPSAILHVVRNRLEDPKTREYFETEHIPYVEVSKRPIPISYFLRRMIWDYLAGFTWLVIRQTFAGRSSPLLNAAASVVSPNLFRVEILELSHRMQVFVSRDEYDVTHILRTMLYDKRGGKTIGFNHGDDCFTYSAMSYLCDHVFCFPGQFHKDLLARNSRFSPTTTIIGAGIYGLDATYEHVQKKELPHKYQDLRSRHKLVGVFPSTYQENYYLTRAQTLRFYKAVLGLLDKNPNILLVIKPKREGPELRDSEFLELVAKAGDRVIWERDVQTYDLLPVFDLAICISITSAGLDGLMTGIPVIYYDEGEFSPHPYGQYDKQLVARTPAELEERVQNCLTKKEYVDPHILDHIRQHHGLRFDGKVTERFRGIVRDTLHSLSPAGHS